MPHDMVGLGHDGIRWQCSRCGVIAWNTDFDEREELRSDALAFKDCSAAN